MKRFAITALAAIVCLCSCMDTETILYRGSMFGTINGPGIMLGDDSHVYHFRNYTDWENFPASGRVVAIFDVYKLMDGTQNDYDAKILSIAVPLCKDPVICETPEEDEALGDDPLAMYDGYFSGGYLNLLCGALLSESSTVEHKVNLQIVPGENADTLHTVMRHNAGTDKVTEINSEFYSARSFYACFPLEDQLPADKSVVLEIKWLWDGEWHTAYTEIKK